LLLLLVGFIVTIRNCADTDGADRRRLAAAQAARETALCTMNDPPGNDTAEATRLFAAPEEAGGGWDDEK
jgi:hypothetical protein